MSIARAASYQLIGPGRHQRPISSVNTAKAVAGVLRVPGAAIPTTLSSAEMTRIHWPPAGFEDRATFIRPSVVLNDPALCASQPIQALAASSANMLAHAVEGGASKLGNPVSVLVAREAEASRLKSEAAKLGADLQRLKRIDMNLERRR